MSDKLRIDIGCPSCNHSFEYAIENMKPGNSVDCPNCKSKINFIGDDFSKVQRSFDALNRALEESAKNFRIKF
jgi:hypothetical protein